MSSQRYRLEIDSSNLDGTITHRPGSTTILRTIWELSAVMPVFELLTRGEIFRLSN
jgi:hypothetical protein